MTLAGMKSEPPEESAEGGGAVDRRALRFRYLAVKNLISEVKVDAAGTGDLSKFGSFFTQVENLHSFVENPREQVADAEALLGITNSLLSMVKSQNSGGIRPAEFVNALLIKFRQKKMELNTHNICNMISWKRIGLAVSHVFRKSPECHTMTGPMDTTLKQRNTTLHRKRQRPTRTCYPEELPRSEPEAKNDTEGNMFIMFRILRKKRRVRLENLVLNRLSFAQTAENIFALSFLVKDGRAEISRDDDGRHLVSPRNAPVARPDNMHAVAYHHFILRFDITDWKVMLDFVPLGEELMPHRRSNQNTCFISPDEAGRSEEAPFSDKFFEQLPS